MPQLQTLFWSARDKRCRTGWRLLGEVVLSVVISWLTLGFLSTAHSPFGISSGVFWGSRVFIATLSVWLARRWFDRRSFQSLGFVWNRWAMLDLAFGFWMAGFLIACIFAVESLAGWLTIQGFVWQQLPLGAIARRTLQEFLIIGVIASWTEELVDRGYRLQNLTDGLNLPLGIILSSIPFGLRHLGNPNATWLSTLFIMLAGGFLAYGWVRTQQLWIPLGLHAGWNVFESTIFGFPVSGLERFRWVESVVDGPTLLTGGAFGPEAGFLAVFSWVLGVLLIHAWTAGRQPRQTASSDS